MGTLRRRQAWPVREPWSLREILEAAVYVAASAGAVLFFFLAAGWLLASLEPLLPR